MSAPARLLMASARHTIRTRTPRQSTALAALRRTDELLDLLYWAGWTSEPTIIAERRQIVEEQRGYLMRALWGAAHAAAADSPRLAEYTLNLLGEAERIWVGLDPRASASSEYVADDGRRWVEHLRDAVEAVPAVAAAVAAVLPTVPEDRTDAPCRHQAGDRVQAPYLPARDEMRAATVTQVIRRGPGYVGGCDIPPAVGYWTRFTDGREGFFRPEEVRPL